MADKMYVGDIGTEFLINSLSDLTGATVTNILVKKPGIDEIEEWEGTVENISYVSFITVDGSLSVKGNYKAQLYIELPNWTGMGETFEFEVFAPFK